MTALVDRLGFGCVGLSLAPTAAKAVGLLEAVHDLGIRYFDTAPIYGRGYSERLLGRFLRGRREKVIVVTKFGLSPPTAPRLPVGVALGLAALKRRLRSSPAPSVASPAPPLPTVGQTRRISRAEVQSSFDASRRSLGTDYVDVYLLHEDLPAALEPDALELLLQLRAAGAVRQLGVAAAGGRYANLTPSDLAGWDVLQYEYGPAWPWTAGLPRRFPRMQHVFHSSLHGCLGADPAVPARTMAHCLTANPEARLLFSSTKLAHIRDNLRYMGG